MYASILKKGERVSYKFQKGRHGYIHIADTKGIVVINDDVILRGGDGAFISGEFVVDIEGQAERSEFIFFDLK
jgi:Quercetinase C-terminal cupin domain